jgi:acyl-CoA synthetase (AMP-forming)/AMP-acid ligase II
VKIETSSAITGVGKPLKNTSAMVIADKAEFNLLPRGAVGLLCFGGDQVVSRKRLTWNIDLANSVSPRLGVVF